MNLLKRRQFGLNIAVLCLVGAGVSLSASGAFAQVDFPTRPIKLVIPFAPGGATDILGRLLASELRAELGRPVVPENKPGAAAVLGATHVARAPPDGYTILLGAASTVTLNPAIRQNLPYHPIKSFTPPGMVADLNLVLVTANDTPGANLKELVNAVKAAPEKYSYG